MTVGFHIGAATNTGVQREVNQDSYAFAPGFAVVADGMGGHRGGEVASSLAVQEMLNRFVRPDMDTLVETVGHANRRILDAAAADPQLHGMGTTVVALGLIDTPDGEGPALGAINVGDSRMYRLTGVELQQLTEDHSLVEALVREGRLTPEQAEVHPQRNIVTRALGVVEDQPAEGPFPLDAYPAAHRRSSLRHRRRARRQPPDAVRRLPGAHGLHRRGAAAVAPWSRISRASVRA